MEPKSPAVTCSSCERSWHSASMAEGLRLLGHCPRCGGDLEFTDREADASPMDRLTPEDAVAIAPHLVLGIPRH